KPVAQEKTDAPRIDNDEFHAAMQSCPAGIQSRDANLEQRPPIRRRQPVGHLTANSFQLGCDIGGVAAGKIEYFKRIGRNILQYLLLSVRPGYGAQHIVTLDQEPPRAIQPRHICIREFYLAVDLTRHLPELDRIRAADPVRLLHVGQRKRQISILWLGHNLRWSVVLRLLLQTSQDFS